MVESTTLLSKSVRGLLSISSVVDWIPLVRELVSLSMLFLSVILGSSLSLVVMAIAWLRYHPLYGMAVLLVAATPFIISHFTSRKSAARKGT